MKLPHSKHLKIGALAVLLVVTLILIGGYYRQVPLALNIEPKTAVVTVNGQAKVSGDKIGFGIARIEVKAANYTPFITARKLGFFSTLKITAKLRPLSQPQKIADGDLLRQDDQGKLYYRSQGQIYQNNIPITGSGLDNLVDMVVSPDGKLAWVKFQDGANGILDFARYNVTNLELVRWEDGVASATWLPSSKTSDPDNQRLIYLKDGVLHKTDPLRTKVERLLDINPENIQTANLAITPQEDIMILVGNANLYFMELKALTLSKAASGGVTSAVVQPDGKAVVFSQNNQLHHQKFYLPKQFSTNPEDIANIGKVVVEQAVPLKVFTQASDGFFSQDSKHFIAVAQDKLTVVNLQTGIASSLFHEPLPAGSGLFKRFSDVSAYFAASGAIYQINLDYGSY